MENENKNKTITIPHWDILKWIILGLCGLIILVFVFGLGMWVGTKKAQFSYKWAENYQRNFAGPRAGVMNNLREFPAGDFLESHGSVGKIIKIDNDNIIIQGRDNKEKTIIVNEKTAINGSSKNLKISDLKVDDLITIIGSPNDSGQIEAKLIRVLPPPPGSLEPPQNPQLIPQTNNN